MNPATLHTALNLVLLVLALGQLVFAFRANKRFAGIFAGIAIGLFAAGFTIPQLLLATALMNAVVALYIYRLVPEFLMRFIVWMLIHSVYRLEKSGLENIPDQGGAVIVCNHVSFMDALVIAACWNITYLFRLGFERWISARPAYDGWVLFGVVAAWAIGAEGRKHFAGTALYSAAGMPVAVARATWIEIPSMPGDRT